MLFSYHRIISTSLVSNKQKITCYLSYSCCQIRILSMGLTYCPSPICLLLCKVIMTVWLYIILLSTRLFSKKINTRKWKSDLSWNYLIYFPLEVITETLDGASCVLVIRKFLAIDTDWPIRIEYSKWRCHVPFLYNNDIP